MKLFFFLFSFCTILFSQSKIPVNRTDQLPIHKYSIPSTALTFLKSEKDYSVLAKQMKTDIETDLNKYQINIAEVYSSYIQFLKTACFMISDYDCYFKYFNEATKDLNDNEKILQGLIINSIAKAKTNDSMEEDKVFYSDFLTSLKKLSPDIRNEFIKNFRVQFKQLDKDFILGPMANGFDAELKDRKGKLSISMAHKLLGSKYILDFIIPRMNLIEKAFKEFD